MSLDALSYGNPTREEFTEFFIERRSLSDSDAVIRNGSVIDVLLRNLLIYHLDPQPSDLPIIFLNGGKYATFSAKIKWALKYKLISRDVRRDLEILKNIRNVFAHSARNINLESAELKALCGKFKSLPSIDKQLEHRTGRYIFDRVTHGIILTVMTRMGGLYEGIPNLPEEPEIVAAVEPPNEQSPESAPAPQIDDEQNWKAKILEAYAKREPGQDFFSVAMKLIPKLSHAEQAEFEQFLGTLTPTKRPGVAPAPQAKLERPESKARPNNTEVRRDSYGRIEPVLPDMTHRKINSAPEVRSDPGMRNPALRRHKLDLEEEMKQLLGKTRI